MSPTAHVSWGAFALALAIMAVLLRLLAPDAFWRISQPVFRASDALSSSIGRFFSGFGDAAALSARIDELSAGNAALIAENRAFREKLSGINALAESGAEGILAGVVSRPPVSPYDALIVSAGSEDGVTPGMEAFGQGGVPIGIVSSVLGKFSRVTLFSSPTVQTEAWAGDARMPLSLRGAGAGAFYAEAPRGADLQEGEAVFAPGPGALPIGTIARVRSDPSLPSVTLQILPAINPFTIDWVELRATGPAFASALSWATSSDAIR